jgi:xanthine/CO dehydrogenase XdhC/CoxF family maturation factor
MSLFSTLTAGALALAAAVPVARPAADAAPGTQTALALTNLFCEDVGGGGLHYNVTNCSVTASGGAGGNTYDWNVIVNYREDDDTGSYIEGVCSGSYHVSVTVHDAVGASATRSGTFICYAS